MWWCRIYLVLCLSCVSICGASAQQVSPRIAGLEGNEEYMSLLREDARLQGREDSLIRVVGDMRQQFREAPGNRQQFADAILLVEEEIFGIRNTKGRLTDRITTIEQDWVISNLGSSSPSTAVVAEAVVEIPEAEKRRNLVDNRYFRDELSDADYVALMQAQHDESTILRVIDRYMSNYANMSDLAARYAATADEAEALELFGKYETLQGLNNTLSDSLSAVWSSVFDDKTYAYGYLLDKLGRDDLLSRGEDLLSKAEQKLAEVRGQYASDAIADYLIRKVVVVDYEEQIASLLRLDRAKDSLGNVASQVKQSDFRVPKIEVAERYFIDYAPVVFASPAKYDAQHPIPECRVFQVGAVYRVLLGTFSTKRPVSAFRGTYPLCWQTDERGRWLYFAGGFATEAEAKEAVTRLKTRGFVRPEIVVWRDGVYRNLTRNPEQHPVMYRVEIVGDAALSEAVKAAITASAGERELSRVGQMFVVGVFEERIEADKVAEAVRKADGALEIKVAEMTKNQE